MSGRRHALLWMALGLLALALLASAPGAWAQPGQDVVHQTVPTPTPVRSPTPAPPSPGGPGPYIRLEASAAGVLPGGTFRYQATVGNGGEGVAREARLVLHLPAALTLLAVEPAGTPFEVTDGGVVVPLGDLAAGTEVVLRFQVRVSREVPLGAVLEAWAELVWDGGQAVSEAVYVALPPGVLPVTGGARPGL